MKTIDNYIIEKLKINKSTKQQYTCQPKDRAELRKILEERLEQDKDADLNDIDVSEIKTMINLFLSLNPCNIDISQWDVSNVENMGSVFYGCENLDCDLSDWNVSNVKFMRYMFRHCEKFDCDLSDWKVSNDTDMRDMFDGCRSMKNKPSWYKE